MDLVNAGVSRVSMPRERTKTPETEVKTPDELTIERLVRQRDEAGGNVADARRCAKASTTGAPGDDDPAVAMLAESWKPAGLMGEE